LIGLKSKKFDVIEWQFFTYCDVVIVKNSNDGFVWRLIVVYGPAYDEYKLEFIRELHTNGELVGPYPYGGGDFNLVRSQSEKNNKNVNF
jgi:hypothetical protein